jgi:hypothetical protein
LEYNSSFGAKSTAIWKLFPGPNSGWIARLRGCRAGSTRYPENISRERAMRAFAAAALAVGLSVPAQAQVVKDQIVIQQGLQTVLQFTEPFSSASVGDPTILDAIPRSDRLIVLQGKQSGQTDILVLIDGRPLRHITVTVQPGIAGGKVVAHNKKNLSEYTAYSCNPSCTRMKDDFEGKDIILFGPGGTPIGISTTGGVTTGGQPNFAR